MLLVLAEKRRPPQRVLNVHLEIDQDLLIAEAAVLWKQHDHHAVRPAQLRAPITGKNCHPLVHHFRRSLAQRAWQEGGVFFAAIVHGTNIPQTFFQDRKVDGHHNINLRFTAFAAKLLEVSNSDAFDLSLGYDLLDALLTHVGDSGGERFVGDCGNALADDHFHEARRWLLLLRL